MQSSLADEKQNSKSVGSGICMMLEIPPLQLS
jgi:hypothetical protein